MSQFLPFKKYLHILLSIGLLLNIFQFQAFADVTPTPSNTSSSSLQVSLTPNPAADQITTSTESVEVTITLPSSDTGYKYCLDSDTENNCKGDSLKDASNYISRGVFTMKVCGAGASKLKTNCGSGDWFHVASTYVVTLYDGDGNQVASAPFFVAPLFPIVNFTTPNGQSVAITVDKDTGDLLVNKNTVDNWILDPSHQDQKTGDYRDPQISNPVSAFMSTPGEAKGGKRENNYRIELNAEQSDYDTSGCVAVKGDQNESAKITSDKLDVGSYQLTIQDQINDSQGDAIEHGAKSIIGGALSTIKNGIKDVVKGSADLVLLPLGKDTLHIDNPLAFNNTFKNCQGGFTYYTIPINVTKNDQGQTITTIDIASIEADPENWYLSSDQKRKLGLLPCAGGTDSNGNTITIPSDASPIDKMKLLRQISECTVYSTAIADVGITPLAFIQTFAKILLEIGALAVIGYLIYGGWLILTSRGDKEKLQKAREMITSAIIGFIFIVLSFAILGFIGVDILRLPGFSH